jgi:hypothetical protein
MTFTVCGTSINGVSVLVAVTVSLATYPSALPITRMVDWSSASSAWAVPAIASSAIAEMEAAAIDFELT